jgi:hypothetical protein
MEVMLNIAMSVAYVLRQTSGKSAALRWLSNTIYRVVTRTSIWERDGVYCNPRNHCQPRQSRVDNAFQGVTISPLLSQVYVIYSIILYVPFCLCKIMCYPSEFSFLYFDSINWIYVIFYANLNRNTEISLFTRRWHLSLSQSGVGDSLFVCHPLVS